MSTGQELETTRLRLRPCRAGDAEHVYALWTDADVRRFLFDDQLISPEEVRAHVEASLASFARDGYGLWLAFEREGGGGIVAEPGASAFTTLLRSQAAAFGTIVVRRLMYFLLTRYQLPKGEESGCLKIQSL